MLTEERNLRSTNLDQKSTREILEIINTEDQQVPSLVQAAIPQIEQAVAVIVDRFQLRGRLFYVGAGTSGRIGILDAVECVPTFGVSDELVQGVIAGGEPAIVHSVEGAEDDAQTGQQDLVDRAVTAQDVIVGIAASGRTPYVLGAVAYANEIGAATVGIACNVPSKLLDAVQIPIGVPVGPEVLTGSTRMKAGTATKLILNMLSTTSMIRIGKSYGNLMVDVQPTNEKLVKRAIGIIQQITGCDLQTASQHLAESGNKVKVAIIMIAKDCTRGKAEIALQASGGFLRQALETENEED